MILAIVAASSIITYALTWRAPFAEDDYVFLEAAARAPGLGVLRFFAEEGVMDHHYRPLSDPLFYVVAASPMAYHTLLQILHASAACTLFGVLFALGLGRPAAFLGALLFATRDLAYPSMIWASGVSDLGAALFAFLALLLYLAWLEHRRTWWRILSSAALVVAVLFKETAVVTVALFPLVAHITLSLRRRETRWRELLLCAWPQSAVVLPIVAVQLSLARFQETYGQQLYAMNLGWHTIVVWPRYAAWSLLAITGDFSGRTAQLVLPLTVVLGLALTLAIVRSVPMGVPTSTIALLAVGWLTIAISPALLTPARVHTNYLTIAAAGPCAAAAIILIALTGHRLTRVRFLGIALTVSLIASGPLVVALKEQGRVPPGGWVDERKARRLATVLDELTERVLPDPPAQAMIVLLGGTSFDLTVLGNPDGDGFGPRRIVQSALRWRYGRFDLSVTSAPSAADIPDEMFERVGKIARDEPGRVRIVDVTGDVKDVTGIFLKTADLGEARRLIVPENAGLR